MLCRLSVVNFISRSASAVDRDLLQDFPQDQLYLDLVSSLVATAMRVADEGKIPTLAIAGSQGTGKSTLAQALQVLLQAQHARRVVIISLDDFYLTRADRQQLGEQVHPLLKTRGVPGTHDLGAIQKVLADLQGGGSAEIPVFDKARDDRAETARSVTRADIVICEGWCWGARPEAEESLRAPINSLETERDADGRWRRYVNHQLRAYQPLFSQDFTVFLQVPSMVQVFAWRWQQEQDLAGRAGSPGTMNQDQIREFIQHYERLTRWMLLEMPARSDLTATLNEEHHIVKIETGTDSGSVQ